MKLAELANCRRAGAGLFGALTAGLLTVVVLLAAGCGGESISEAAVTVDTGGRLQITETYFDSGTLPVGQWAEHQFSLKNVGSGPLNLGQMFVKRLEGC